MRTINVKQGTPEWLAHRARHLNASDASAMMGKSAYITRTELLKRMATGIEKEVDGFTQKIFDDGHAIEAQARPLVERAIGKKLKPVVGVSDLHIRLSASLDGITAKGDIVWECKQWSAAKAASVDNNSIPDTDYWQCVQQLLVSGAKKLIYTVTDGTPGGTVSCEMLPDEDDFELLIAGWNQFEHDLKNYKPEPVAPVAYGQTPETLPALRIEVTGKVVASNLEVYKEHAIAVFKAINTELATDQDFADAEEAVKWCSGVEAKLAAAKQHALSQTETIDALFRAIDSIGAEARSKRLSLEKLIKSRKDTIRSEIVEKAREALRTHVESLSAGLDDIELPFPSSFMIGINEAIKGKRTLSSLQNAADTVLAQQMIEGTQYAKQVKECCALIEASKQPGLFPDREFLVLSKSPEDLKNLITARIAEEAERRKTPPPKAAVVRPKNVPRPSDTALLTLIAEEYGVSTAKAKEWIRGMKFLAKEAA